MLFKCWCTVNDYVQEIIFFLNIANQSFWTNKEKTICRLLRSSTLLRPYLSHFCRPLDTWISLMYPQKLMRIHQKVRGKSVVMEVKFGTLFQKISVKSSAKAQCLLFSVVFTPTPPSHYGSVPLLPIIFSLSATAVSPVQSCLSIRWERLRGSPNEDERGPLSIQSSLVH